MVDSMYLEKIRFLSEPQLDNFMFVNYELWSFPQKKTAAKKLNTIFYILGAAASGKSTAVQCV